MRAMTGVVLCLWAASSFADCELGKKYEELAQDRLKAYAIDDARGFLQQAADTCPTYAVYHQLGQLAAQSDQPDSKTQAVSAYLEAYARAPSDKARAATLYEYASLLNASGDPQNAYPLIKQARDLDPDNSNIITLERLLDAQNANPTVDQMRAGLTAAIFRPLPAAGSRTRNTSVSKAAATTSKAGGQINIPIHFITGTTTVDAETQPNVAKLADTLADPAFAGGKFVLVGHADERGEEHANMSLSWERATAIRSMVQKLQPGLEGRLEVSGKGELEPLDTRKTESAYRVNRRIQVTSQVATAGP